MRCAALALIILGGLSQVGGVALVFKELAGIGVELERYRENRAWASHGRGIIREARARAAGFGSLTEGMATERGEAAIARLVEHLVSDDGRLLRVRGAWLIIGGIVATTAGGVLSLWA